MANEKQLADYMARGMKDYEEGVKIFKDLGIDSKSNQFFSVPNPSRIHISLLKNKLLNYARVYDVKPELNKPAEVQPNKKAGLSRFEKQFEAKAPKTEKPLIDTNPSVRFEDLPGYLQEAFKDAGALSNEQKTLHAELKSLKDDPSKQKRRSELAKDLVKNKDQVRKIWDEIDTWWNANKDKTREQRIADDAAKAALDKEKRIKANRTYIQRNYGNTKKAEELAKRIHELDKWGIDYAEDIEKAGANNYPTK